MASMWRRAMHYLGLGPDDEYDDYDDYDVAGEHQRPVAPRQPASPRQAPAARPSTPPRYAGTGGTPRVAEPRSSVRTLGPSAGDGGAAPLHHNGNGAGHDPARGVARNGTRAEQSDRTDRVERSARRERTEEPDRSVDPRSRNGVVRPLVPPTPKPHVVGPTSFDDAQEIADTFKVSSPVILNLQGVHRDLSRRIIDFASGLCYGLDGHMERVANQVYLLTPTDVEVSPEERRRLQERGYEA